MGWSLKERQVRMATDAMLQLECSHYDCLCARRRELLAMSDATGRLSLIAEAIALTKTRCRRKELWEDFLTGVGHPEIGDGEFACDDDQSGVVFNETLRAEGVFSYWEVLR